MDREFRFFHVLETPNGVELRPGRFDLADQGKHWIYGPPEETPFPVGASLQDLFAEKSFVPIKIIEPPK